VISEARRRHYLDALGIDAWVSRASLARLAGQKQAAVKQQTPVPPVAALSDLPASFSIGPGSGQTLMLCESQQEASSKLASDIARCLHEAPVWGWKTASTRTAGAEESSQSLETAIRDRLFTRVLIFGAAGKSSEDQSSLVGSARVIYAVSLEELGGKPEHKRKLWSQLVAHGWCKRND
jgi:DNA polymerase III psi subunit